MDRYTRQRTVQPNGARLDDRFATTRVLVVGVGGTGSPLVQLLARAGVGALHLVDPDTVSTSDLARQVLYHDADVGSGRPKIEAALEAVRAIGGRTTVTGESVALTPRNAPALIADVDFVFDATDHLPARNWIDSACRAEGRPWIHLAAIEDRWTVIPFLSPIGPCFRCYLPENPTPATLGTCETRGVHPLAPSLAAHHGASLFWGWLGRDEDTPDASGATIVRGRVGSVETRTSRLQRDPECPGCRRGATDADLTEHLRPICGKSRWEGWSERPLEEWRDRLRDTAEWEIAEETRFVRASRADERITIFPDGRFVWGDADANEESARRRLRALLGEL